jgi:6-phosphogluconolactonase
VNVVVAPPRSFAYTAARWIADELNARVAAEGECSLALAGGSTPRAVYQELARLEVPWPLIQVYFGDERRVAANHTDSNYRMVRETLLDRLSAPAAVVHRMQGELEDGAEAAAAYERVLPAHLDLLLLGMGEDAHTASLFPGSPAILEHSRRVMAVPGPPGSDRLTITGSEIERARKVAVLVAGGAKARVVRSALYAAVNPLMRPVQLAKHGTWLLDADAAAQLPPT